MNNSERNLQLVNGREINEGIYCRLFHWMRGIHDSHF